MESDLKEDYKIFCRDKTYIFTLEFWKGNFETIASPEHPVGRTNPDEKIYRFCEIFEWSTLIACWSRYCALIG